MASSDAVSDSSSRYKAHEVTGMKKKTYYPGNIVEDITMTALKKEKTHIKTGKKVVLYIQVFRIERSLLIKKTFPNTKEKAQVHLFHVTCIVYTFFVVFALFRFDSFFCCLASIWTIQTAGKMCNIDYKHTKWTSCSWEKNWSNWFIWA